MQKVFKFEKKIIQLDSLGLFFLARIIYPSDKSLARIVVFCNRLIIFYTRHKIFIYQKRNKTQIDDKIPEKTTSFLLTIDRTLSKKKDFHPKRKSPKKSKYLY
jgi:hypothetical protein